MFLTVSNTCSHDNEFGLLVWSNKSTIKKLQFWCKKIKKYILY